MSNQLSEKVNKTEFGLLPDMKRGVLLAKEKGASSWLAVTPIQEYGFAFAKSEFRYVFQIRYNK